MYLTLSELDVDGKPRWRYAPGRKNAHELIDKTAKVDVLEPVDRWPKKKA